MADDEIADFSLDFKDAITIVDRSSMESFDNMVYKGTIKANKPSYITNASIDNPKHITIQCTIYYANKDDLTLCEKKVITFRWILYIKE